LGLRYMPDIFFHYDESLEYGRRIDAVIKSIQEEKAEQGT
jgi:ribosome-binding factor A